ncbi:MAG: nucleotide sugar dehydrogenase [Candidatus Babeliales bacterium]|jgi:UDP-N-acetyl-D-mannosaminuronic acid dehydrogenase
MKKVCIVGLGYVGLPTALLAARAGLKVVGIDTDQARVDLINTCSLSFEEPEVLENLHEVCGAQNFYATTTYEQADYFLISVPVLVKQDAFDLSALTDVAVHIADVIKKGDTVILESTVPVGTTKSLADVIAQESGLQAGHDFFIAYCSERILPGNIFQELKVNERIIGGLEQNSTQKAAEFYKYFVSGDLYLTDSSTAEMVKLVETSFYDNKSAFAEQVAGMAEQAGLNPYEVIELANKHPRVSIDQPSCGVGGHSLPIEPWFLIKSFLQKSQLLQAARMVNEQRIEQVLQKIIEEVLVFKERSTKPCTVLLLGLTYKADVYDLKESAACFIAQRLVVYQGVNLLVCDPHVSKSRLQEPLKDKMISLFGGIDQADLIVGLVAHTQFKTIDKRLLQPKKTLDFCGIFFEPKQESIEQEQFFWPANAYAFESSLIKHKKEIASKEKS